MASLESSARTIINKCMAVKQGEKVLIITDDNLKKIGELLLSSAKEISDECKLVIVPVASVSGEEPPDYVAEMMLSYDVIILATTKSLSHTKARVNALAADARIASMPNITEDLLLRDFDTDYEIIKKRSTNLVNILNSANEVSVKTNNGTNIKMSIKGRDAHGADGGIFNEPGKWGNLPEGEACIAPIEGTTNGVFVIDASMAGVGIVKEPIKVTVKEGVATEISGGKEADKLKDILDSINDPNAYNIAELGIGTNDVAKISGNVLEDEKVMGTAHIAFGNNKSFEGKIDVPVHLDGVFIKPTIIVDGKTIMKDGTFLE